MDYFEETELIGLSAVMGLVFILVAAFKVVRKRNSIKKYELWALIPSIQVWLYGVAMSVISSMTRYYSEYVYSTFLLALGVSILLGVTYHRFAK